LLKAEFANIIYKELQNKISSLRNNVFEFLYRESSNHQVNVSIMVERSVYRYMLQLPDAALVFKVV